MKTTITPLRALAVAALLAMSAVVFSPMSATADNYPGLDDIAAAKAAVADAAATVDQLDAAIVSLEAAAALAEQEALRAGDSFALAQDLADTARADAEIAVKRADAADAELEAARTDLGAIAAQSYRNGDALGELGILVGAQDFADVVARSEDYDRAAAEVDSIVQSVSAAQIVAETLRASAEQAKADAEKAEAEAQVAFVAAQDAQAIADQAVADAVATREAATARLAELRQVSVEMEQARQDGLAAERAHADEVAYLEALAAAEAGSGTGGAGGGSTGGGSTGGGSTGGGSTGGGSTGGGTTTGTWKSTEDQGAVAVAKALTLMGTAYQTGGNGPAYDCSGVTYAAWKAAGYTIPRSSQTQYNALTHVPLSQLRPGDLVFYGTNRDATKIYHVAIYIGDGMVAEATSPGKVAQIRAYDLSWRIGNLIAYAGRP